MTVSDRGDPLNQRFRVLGNAPTALPKPFVIRLGRVRVNSVDRSFLLTLKWSTKGYCTTQIIHSGLKLVLSFEATLLAQLSVDPH